MGELAKNIPSAPVAMDRGLLMSEKLTANQEKLMELLVECLKTGEPVTIDRIISTYRKCKGWYNQAETERVSRYTRGEDGVWVWRTEEVPWDDERARPQLEFRAMCWFRSNLGSCIVRGRLIAIPVIDVP